MIVPEDYSFNIADSTTCLVPSKLVPQYYCEPALIHESAQVTVCLHLAHIFTQYIHGHTFEAQRFVVTAQTGVKS